MLRSFDYAGAVIGEKLTAKESSQSTGEVGQQVSEHYRHNGRQAFLDAYHESAAGIPHQWDSPDGDRAALELFVLEKTAYEIAYEAANRPTWLGVPLRGLVAIADQMSTGEQHD